MPLDYKRFNGPEDSIPYQRFIKDYVKTYDEQCGELLDKNERRRDGRSMAEGRSKCDKFFAKIDMVSQAKGSSYVELNKTKVVCSVFDPREIPHQNEFSQKGQIFCEVKFAPFSCKGERRSPVPDAEEKALSVALRKALDPCVCLYLFPNFQIDIFVYILENDGACLAAAVNAAGLALADGAVPMYDIIASCSLAIIDGSVFMDPTYHEETLALAYTAENTNHGTITVSILPELKQITDFRQVGSMDIGCITEAIGDLEKEIYNILPHIHKVIVTSVEKNIERQEQFESEDKEQEELLNTRMAEWRALLNAD